MLASLVALPLLAACSGTGEPATSDTREAVNYGTAVPPNTRDKLGLVYINEGDCSGVLLEPSWVLTAQHCYQDVQTTGQNPVGIRVALASMGPLWAPSVSDRVYAFGQHDVVLVHLSTPLAPSGSTTFKNTLTTVPLGDMRGRTLSCYGQGDDVASKARLDSVWRTADLMVTGSSVDRYDLAPNGLAQTLANGDSGGPCFYNGQLVGIQSSDNYSCSALDPNCMNPSSMHQTSLYFLKDWINAIVHPAPTSAVVSGSFSVVQSNYGLAAHGNFELVAPFASHGLGHYWENNAVASRPWALGEVFAVDIGAVSGASLIESSAGNLEVVAVAGTSLYSYWKSPSGSWSTTFAIPGANHERGAPSFVQSTFAAAGQPGNFEVAVPNAKYGVDYFWRNNSIAGSPWESAPTFAQGIGRVDDVTMFESAKQTMELVARSGPQVWHLSRSTSGTWSSPRLVSTHASGRPAFLQRKASRVFELFVPSTAGGYDEYTLDPSVSNAWSAPIPAVHGAMENVGASVVIESNFGVAPGNLELFGASGSTITHAWRENEGFPTTLVVAHPTFADYRFIGPFRILG